MKEVKQLAIVLAEYNDFNYNLLKSSEELQELSLILTQKLTKPTKVNDQDIIDEIGDVVIRLEILKELYSKKKLRKRLEHKIKKYKTYIKEDEYVDV